MCDGGGPKRSDSGSRSNWARKSMYVYMPTKIKNKNKKTLNVRVRPRPPNT